MASITILGFSVILLNQVLFICATTINRQPTLLRDQLPAASVTPELTIKTCTPKDFIPSCNLSCYVTNPNLNLLSVSHTFTYYASDPSKSIPLLNYIWSYATDSETNPSSFKLTLPLTDFSAGRYECTISVKDTTFQNITTFNNIFKIDVTSGIDGVWLGSSCKSPQECYAVNATCDGTCKCAQHNYINYNGQDDTPACLSAVAPGGACLIDDQCEVYQPGTHCIGNECVYSTGLPTAQTDSFDTSTEIPKKWSTTDIIALSDTSVSTLAFIVIIIVLSIIAARVKIKPTGSKHQIYRSSSC